MRGEPRVKVELEVETECGPQVARAASVEFVLENPAACALRDDTGVVHRRGALSEALSWTPHAASQAYEVCITASNGETACTRPTAAQLTLTPAQQAPMLVSIAPVCAGTAGTPRFYPVPAAADSAIRE